MQITTRKGEAATSPFRLFRRSMQVSEINYFRYIWLNTKRINKIRSNSVEEYISEVLLSLTACIKLQCKLSHLADLLFKAHTFIVCILIFSNDSYKIMTIYVLFRKEKPKFPAFLCFRLYHDNLF